jgi:hypothetical protein
MAEINRQHGGTRPGAGRKPNRVKFQTEIARADRRIAKNLVRYIENLEQLADGVTVQETDKDGRAIVYTRPPDRVANEYLINRIMGKPIEKKEITGEDGEPLLIREVIVEKTHERPMED